MDQNSNTEDRICDSVMVRISARKAARARAMRAVTGIVLMAVLALAVIAVWANMVE